MLRSSVLCLALGCLGVVSAQNLRTKIPASSPVQVVYVIDGSTITTYDVDPHTYYATKVGTLTAQASTYPNIVASPNDHFIYYWAYDDPSGKSKHLWVYATDTTGSPQNPAVQKIDAKGLYGTPTFNPSGNFFYTVYASPDKDPSYTDYTIRRYLVDPNSGKLSQPKNAAKYKLPSGGGGSEGCALLIDGFKASGDKMYDEVNCDYHGGQAITYNERSVNLKTGGLGPDVEVYSWNNSTEGGEYVQFVKNLVFDFVVPNNYERGVNSIDIYTLKPHIKTPLLHCTASMLEACGYGGGVAHPSGQYVFMAISQDATQIDRVDLKNKKIVDTGNYIPFTFFGVFSPDGTIAYAYNSYISGYYIEVYGFDATTSNVTPGDEINVPNGGDPFFVAQRN